MLNVVTACGLNVHIDYIVKRILSEDSLNVTFYEHNWKKY